MGDTRALAEFAVGFSLDACPPEVVHQAKRCTIETIACQLGGARTPLVQAALKALDRMEAGGSEAASRRSSVAVAAPRPIARH